MKKYAATKMLILLLCGAVLVLTSANCKGKCELNPKEGFTIVGDDADCHYNEITYNVGDLYNVNGVKGIVFAVSADKKHGSILSIESITLAQYRWAKVYEVTGATDTLDGANNMTIIKTMTNWATNYPAFKYLDDKGFYIPAKNELRTIFNNYNTIKSAVEKNGGSFNYDNNNSFIYSSTEVNSNQCYTLSYNNSNGIVFDKWSKKGEENDDFTFGVKKF